MDERCGSLPVPRSLRAVPLDDAGLPRVAELADLLRDVAGLRSSLRKDLALAATAVEAGADDLAGWLVVGDGREVRAFEQRTTARLARLAAAEAVAIRAPEAPRALAPVQRGRRRLPPLAQLLAAAAVIGFLAGLVPALTHSRPATTSAAALQSYATVTRLASTGAPASRITQAAEEFHADLAPVVADAGSDPAATERALALLQGERAVIAGGNHRVALGRVLRQADAMVARLSAALPAPVDPGAGGLAPARTSAPVPTAPPLVPVPSLPSAAPQEPDVRLGFSPTSITGP
ncbi:MAG: hypothetical protein JWN35_2111 [Frankiales bacterium]|nr:hypothetical protein [Frankiales bacterium]